MGTFVEFIESESFFPILILLLVLLMFIFTSILMSGKKNQRKRIQERKKIKIDESAQVQLVQENGVAQKPLKEEKLEVETGSSEVSLFLEETDPLESVEVNEVEDFYRHNQDNSNMKMEVETDKTESERMNGNNEPKQTFNVNIKEESDLVDLKYSDENKKIPVVDSEIQDAFEIRPDDNNSINENIEVDNPKEYISDKTEVIDFPDFDSIIQETDAEEEIIDAANKYIESIMKGK